jgi:exopolysaccharide biosynthesis protein
MLDYRHPRSAICIDQSNNLYFVAIDGRYTDSNGVTTNELAQIMQGINCWDAMNLDGGGSTLLYANNKILNRPSDASGPRKVVSVVLVRDRYKKKVNLAQ